MEPNEVVQALKVLQDEGREDLLREGVLEQAWVGLRRPKRLSADGVSAAVAACTSPVKALKKFKAKSVGGRKVARSPQSDEEPISEVRYPIECVAGKRRGGSRFPRRQGASLARHVAAGGRGATPAGAVCIPGRMGVRAVFTHARSARKPQQAQPPLEAGGEREVSSCEEGTLGGAPKMTAPLVSDWLEKGVLEKRHLGAAGKMAAPILIEEGEVVVISDEEEVEQVCQEGAGGQVFGGLGGIGSKGAGRVRQCVPRLFSPMLYKVQSWQMDNEAFFRLGEQVEFVDVSGRVLSGTVCGETSGAGSVDRAYVKLDVSQPFISEGSSGCDTPPALGGQRVKAVYRPSGRMVGDRSLPVKVRAPSAHRPEERVRSGAVRLTSGDAARACDAQPSTSQGAGDGWADWDDELLDYEDLEEQVTSKQRDKVQGEAPGVVQGGHVLELPHELSASNLPRGEEVLVGLLGTQRGRGKRGFFRRSGACIVKGADELSSKVDASIQVNAVTVEGKLEARHVPGVNNDIADALSRFQWQRFRGLAPGADVLKTVIPQDLWALGD
ncbi:hypothetical protein NDU88_006139 [Pleurodeles waltl]|uniref:Cyclic nucleotide-binding domain-containing protein n=1 Tax=Pleurodeles waltl TaxID=8319 RepID=A0AAV7TER9_PLEWA|nr:hypothetical protein NDU88_006139 [Pleurodeles waltl]